MRLLVTGGSSYLGQHLVPLAPAGWEVAYTCFQRDPLARPGGIQLDLRHETALQEVAKAFRPQVIIHLAGSNRPAGTLDDVIRGGTARVAAAAARLGARLIHLSTDVVFDGQHAPYREEDPPAPLHAYGRAKAAAEEIVRRLPNSVIVRTSLIYSLELLDRGTEWMVNTLRAGRPVTLFTDQMRNPVWAVSLSQACLELAASDYCGILHVAGRQCLSRADFALKMLDYWGISERDQLQFGPGDPDRWPQNCCLDTGRARSLLQTPLPGVDDVLTQDAVVAKL